jgi:DNA-binding HxlR family transcriptional regulator
MVVLLERTHRFGELRDRIGGVSEKMLAQTLQTLEADGFVSRKAYPVIPPKVEYSLTAMGREMADLLKALTLRVEADMPKVLQARAVAGRAAKNKGE